MSIHTGIGAQRTMDRTPSQTCGSQLHEYQAHDGQSLRSIDCPEFAQIFREMYCFALTQSTGHLLYAGVDRETSACYPDAFAKWKAGHL
jgi:hypothetical protein